MNLTDKNEVQRLLQRHHIWAQKRLGQHFLIDPAVIAQIIETSDLRKDDIVLEVGPGYGVLTQAVAPHVQKVLAVELDRELIPVLTEVTASMSNVTIYHQDIRSFAPPTTPYKVVANIPYYITGKLLRFFLEESPFRPQMLVLMTQKEVAEKIMQTAPHANLLSTAVHTLGKPKLVAIVPRSAFYPAPTVDSAILKIVTHAPPADITLPAYFRIVRAAFRQSRKQIHNGLSANLALPVDTVKKWLTTCAIDILRRPETLSVEEWTCLARHRPTTEVS